MYIVYDHVFVYKNANVNYMTQKLLGSNEEKNEY